MKRLCTILFIIICAISLNAQNNVFVLVDVSKSVKKADLVAAKQALTDVLLGNQLSNSNVKDASIQDLQQFKIAVGDKLSVLKFGDQQTTLNISPQPITIQSLPNDIFQTLNSFPVTPTDDNTYWKLAKAKVADYAVRNGLKNYKLYIISDENEDNFGPGGKPDYQNQNTLEMAEGYNTKNNPAIEDPSIQVKIATMTQGFKLNFCPKVDVSKYKTGGGGNDSDGDGVSDVNDKCPGTPTGTPVNSDGCPTTIQTPSLKFLDNLKRKKSDPLKVKTTSQTINWSCINCPPDPKFKLVIRKDKKTIQSILNINPPYNYSFQDNGLYEFTITGLNFSARDNTNIEKESEINPWLIAILLLAIGCGFGYYYWNKKRQEKIDVFASNKVDDIFSKSSGGTTSSNSSNTDYF